MHEFTCQFFDQSKTLFCIESPESCIYLNQSELSNFFMYLIIACNVTVMREPSLVPNACLLTYDHARF